MRDISKLLGFKPTIWRIDGHGMDTAGKRTPYIPGVGVIQENEFNRPTSDFLGELAEKVGFRVVDISPELNAPSLDVKTKRINDDYAAQKKLNPDLTWDQIGVVISIHFDAFDGVMDSQGRTGGVSVFHSASSVPGKKLAELVLKNLVGGTEQTNRGIKTNSLHITRETIPPAILCELGFMDITREALLMKQEAFQRECARELLAGACEYYGYTLDYLMDDELYHGIMGPSSATLGQCKEWAKLRGATDLFISLADVYFAMATRKGIDAAGAYAQSAKETGYGKFGGVIDATYKNPCGLKIKNGGGNYDPNAHQRFDTWEIGITAHLDHLALYAGADGYPRLVTPDPRHFAWIKGRAKSWEDLGGYGKWAPSPTYGTSIVEMIKSIQLIDAPDTPDVCVKYKHDLDLVKIQLSDMEYRALKAELIIKKINELVLESFN